MKNSVSSLMTILAIVAMASLMTLAPMNASALAIWDFTAILDPTDAIEFNPDNIWNDNDCGEGMANVWKYKDDQDNYVVEYEIMLMGNLDIVAQEDFDSSIEGGGDCFVTGIHMHNAALGNGMNGPHMVNIYGMPGFDDGDVVIDPAQKKISGIYTSADRTCALDLSDCVGGDTRPITDEFIEDLKNGDWYVAVHTKGNDAPFTEIRGFLEFVPKVGGEFLSIDSSALLLAGLQSSAIWMLPVLAGIAGTGAYFVRARMNKN